MKRLNRSTGKVSGVYYKGYAATFVGRDGNALYCVVANNMRDLRQVWGKLSDEPLVESLISEVAIFQGSKVIEKT